MGAWGAGLYQDDFAADLKSSFSVLAKVPVTGGRLLEIILEMYAENIKEEETRTIFWLVLADQFERRGIECPSVAEQALAIIASEEDLRLIEFLGADKSFISKRKKTLIELSNRLNSPRPFKKPLKHPKPPAFGVDVGEVYSFPTMKGKTFNSWFPSWKADKFEPDGWGAAIIFDRGRVFEWMPWCAVASVATNSQSRPTIDDVLQAQLLYPPGNEFVPKCVPYPTHIKRIGMELLGHLSLNTQKCQQYISNNKLINVIKSGSSFCSVIYSCDYSKLETYSRLGGASTLKLSLGPQVSELLIKNAQ